MHRSKRIVSFCFIGGQIDNTWRGEGANGGGYATKIKLVAKGGTKQLVHGETTRPFLPSLGAFGLGVAKLVKQWLDHKADQVFLVPQ